MKTTQKKWVSVLLIAMMCLCLLPLQAFAEGTDGDEVRGRVIRIILPKEVAETVGEPEILDVTGPYRLEQVVILSRHNIRSPLSGKDSLLGTVTPHTCFNWTSVTSQLSLRGGALETIMGQYFRKYLIS
jgi:hypothetical protein